MDLICTIDDVFLCQYPEKRNVEADTFVKAGIFISKFVSRSSLALLFWFLLCYSVVHCLIGQLFTYTTLSYLYTYFVASRKIYFGFIGFFILFYLKTD